jgi:hypothetical protein
MRNCLACDQLKETAIDASGLYHGLVGKMEAAHISRDEDLILTLQMRLNQALSRRNKAIAVLTDHRQTHAKVAPGVAKTRAATLGRCA